MKTVVAFIRRHAVTAYYILTFIISWGSIFFGSGGPGGFPKSQEQFEKMLPLFIPLVLLGPALSGMPGDSLTI